jgi:hypothetical protein
MRKGETVDCVEMKRRAAERIYQETKGMTRADLLAYWETHNQRLRELQEAARARKKPA